MVWRNAIPSKYPLFLGDWYKNWYEPKRGKFSDQRLTNSTDCIYILISPTD